LPASRLSAVPRGPASCPCCGRVAIRRSEFPAQRRQPCRVETLVARCRVLEITASTAAVYARLRLGLKEKGKPIPENDLWIAALCVEHEVPLGTFDRHLDVIGGLERRGL
jgi:tRNA(fMet)-specific endonuclease VapC